MKNVLESIYSSYNQTLRQLSNQNARNQSLFDWKFPELKNTSCAANLGDGDCLDGAKNIQLNSLLNATNLVEKTNNPKHVVPSSLREAMIKLDEEKYFLPILLTYLKQPNQSVGTALIKIYSKSDKEVRTNA